MGNDTETKLEAEWQADGDGWLPRFVRPCCDNCRNPAAFIATHEEAGPCFVCEACAKSRRSEYGRRGPRRFFFPEDEYGETCGNCGGCVITSLPNFAYPCGCAGSPNMNYPDQNSR